MHQIDLGFTEIDIHNGFAIGRTKAGHHISIDNHLSVKKSINEHLQPPYGIIIDQKNDYSIDFKTLMHVRSDCDICCIGIVYHRFLTRIALEASAKMMNKPVYFANNAEEVMQWMKDQVDGNIKPEIY